MKQELWPQCQKCFSKQGSAVRMNIHQSIHNMRIRPHHFCVAIALSTSEIEFVKDALQPLVYHTIVLVDRLVLFFTDLLK